ncbi:putative adhesin, partial [Citrobacter koseri]|uniref:putative adhesin n=1 Tax=Citrobacter koseri TaxID=545 RepID=UPI001F3CF57F
GLGLAVFSGGSSLAVAGAVLGVASVASQMAADNTSGAVHAVFRGTAIFTGVTGMVADGVEVLVEHGAVLSLSDAHRGRYDDHLINYDSGITREQEGSFLRYSGKVKKDKVIFVSHSRFQIRNYILGGKESELPESVSINYFVKHGDKIKSTDAVSLYNLLQGGSSTEVDMRMENITHPMKTKNYTLNPITEGMRLNISDSSRYDVVVPVRRCRTIDLLSFIHEKGYKEAYIIGCRAHRI